MSASTQPFVHVPTFDTATEADLPALVDLLGLLFAQEAEFQPDPAAQRRGLALIVRNPEVGAILVARQARDDGPKDRHAEGRRIVAMVNLLFTVSTALGERVALLEDMVVAPDARQSGVGSALLSHATAWVRRRGVRRITLLTDHDNTAAQRFYARQGFVESPMVALRLALP